MGKIEEGRMLGSRNSGRGFGIENGHHPENFASAFITAARGCGVRSLTDFSKGSQIRVDVLSLWVNGKGHPSPDNFGRAVLHLRERGAQEDTIESLQEHYARYLEERSSEYQERNTAVAIKRRMDPPLPIGRFIDSLADVRGTTVTKMSRGLNLKDWLSNVRVQKDMTQETLLRLLAVFQESGILTEDEISQMEQAAQDTIVQIIEERGRMVSVSPLSVKRHQEEKTQCEVYTGEEAGGKLDLTRSAIGQWRRRLGIEHLLLTKDDIARIQEARMGRGNF